MKHDLKIWPQYYSRVADGSKTFEVRVNDRDFQNGDTVALSYFDPELPPGLIFTAQELRKMWDKDFPPMTFKVGYVLPIDENRVVFSLLKTEESK